MRAMILGLPFLACATYDFEPVKPLAIAQTVKQVDLGVTPLKPNMFLVVDKSGSMNFPVDPACTGTCTSRLVSMKSAMDGFLSTSGNIAHLGMATFPQGMLCEPGDPLVGVQLDTGDDSDTRLAQVALDLQAKLDAVTAGGGTPTGATMASLLAIDALHARDRSNYAVLLTDGAPNCNPAVDSATCECTDPMLQGRCSATIGGVVGNECLDDTGSAAQIALLKDKGIKTIVIGFGADVAGSNGLTLQAMAAAGGFARPCQQSSDCGSGDTCNGGGIDACGRAASTCGRNYFQAANATELGAAMQLIRDSIICPPCFQPLNSRPSKPDLVSVIIDGSSVPSGADTWTYIDDPMTPAIQFNGATCSKLTNSTPADPVHVEIRAVESL